MIHVIAIITAKPGRRAELLERFLAVVPIVHTEDGCIEYRPIIDNDAGLDGAREAIGPDTYIVVEKWSSVAALDAHAATDHMRKYGEETGELIASRVLHVMRDAAI
ncbi:quinol monooxygenase YgiN [Rhodanobacter sp. K2T2]|uniref:putative quinol monooxygenase n=1 Tax=Rhodanobacter sp. K2T2 TaxID=2723085 RepID=UPI0015C895DC|nr:putative quinol monooxygenase [Rhodanobacter sp. K2T2]NYE30359.1 quinol monooxygenase YgiN [Rhodanobacter sp. K2T2]